jgi:outer membrane protein assembly factor BamB
MITSIMASRRLPLFPIVTFALGIAGVLYVRSLPEFERNLKGWLTAGIPLLTFLLIFIWFLASSRFTKATRWKGLALLGLILLGLKATTRIDGVVDGTGLPRLVWKWTPSHQPKIAEIAEVIATADAPAASDPRLERVTDVPQFFGPTRAGSAPDMGLAKDWKTTAPKQLWRQEIGLGWSAFAIVRDHAYTQEQRGEDELVTCYHLFTGKLIWAHADKAHFSQWQGGDGPRATPTVDGGRVFTYGATGLLNCLDATTGKPVWQRSVLTENKLANIEWGISASPLVVDDKVIVTGGNTLGPILFAYHRETGAPLWQVGQDQATYASPILTTLAGKRMILSNNARALTAYDPATGAVILDHAWGIDKWPKASQPVIVGPDRVFVSAGYGMGCQLLQISAAAEGKLTATEVWTSMKMKTQFNSPALHEGHLYGLDDGRLACLELSTGERLWKEGRFASGQSLLVGGLILVQSESGPVHLVSAKPDGFQELGKIEALSSKTWNHPVVAGHYLLVRNDREAVCYELP